MLLWRMRPTSSNEIGHVECHLVRRDMEYRLSLRTGKTVIIQEVHRTPISAAERAEDLRRQAIEGVISSVLPEPATDSAAVEINNQPLPPNKV